MVTEIETGGIEPASKSDGGNLVQRFIKDVQESGVAGRESEIGILFLTALSGLQDRPASVILKAESSAGKSFVVERVLVFVPETFYVKRSSLTEKALAYTSQDLDHRILVIAEADGIVGSYLLRTLISEGKVIHEATSGGDTHGMRTTQVVETEGPIGVILTTTLTETVHDNETRMLSLEMRDDRHSRIASLGKSAERASGVAPFAPVSSPVVAGWHKRLAVLRDGDTEVVIPFASRIIEYMESLGIPLPARMNRDIVMLFSLVKSSALLHGEWRDRDEQERIVATVDDYETVLSLVEPFITEQVALSVDARVRDVVEAVGFIIDEPPLPGDGWATQKAIAERLEVDKGTVSRAVQKAKRAGYLRDLERNPGANGSRLVLADQMPYGDTKLFPSADCLREDS